MVESDRPAIFKHIISRFGEDKTARVASFGTLQDKGVIDEIGRHLAKVWKKNHDNIDDNPWSLPNIAKIKTEFTSDPDKTKAKYPEMFYYFDGLSDTKISQSVHPAGMVISPITLPDNYGVFFKDGDICLFLDMENIHDYTGLAKYDFLILKTVQVIRDTCKYLNQPYPKTHEIDWDDQDVWADMIKNPTAIFQFEGKFASDSLRKFVPKSIFDMSIVTACIRPSGTSYRDDLLARKVHKNPSEIIDELLKDNLGYLIYQEDTIKFLQQICGLSGSAADNIRRAIGRKQKDRLDAAMPSILEGYCEKSNQPRDVAEKEAMEFLQVIEDSASYQFGYNHSIAYCLLGYLCAYYRYYHPIEFITAFLNNAANDDDIKNGTEYANRIGIKITMPKWGLSKGDYFFDKQQNIIAKGLSSIKFMSDAVAEELYVISRLSGLDSFNKVLRAIVELTSLNIRQLDILIKIDFFSQFGNQRELIAIADMFFNLFKKGDAKKISKEKVNGTIFEEAISSNSIGITKSGSDSKSYTIQDIWKCIDESEAAIKSLNLQDLDDITKVINFKDVMGYVGYISNKDEDRRKLYVMDIYELHRKKDGKHFGYSVVTKSIGSGVESRFTIMKGVYQKMPIEKGDIIYCQRYEMDGPYYRMTEYIKIS